MPRILAATILTILLLGAPLTAAQPTDRVILVSVDGLRADFLANLLANDLTGDYANFQRLVDEGAATFNARTDWFYTNTLPNHTTILSGRPVLQPAGQPLSTHHGYTSNVDPGPSDTLHVRTSSLSRSSGARSKPARNRPSSPLALVIA